GVLGRLEVHLGVVQAQGQRRPQLDAEALPHRDEPPDARGLDDLAEEGEAEPHLLAQGLAAGGLGELAGVLPRRAEALVRQTGDRQFRGGAFQPGPDGEDLRKVPLGEVADAGAAVGQRLDEPLRLELAERLPDGALADAELGGDAALDDALARRPASRADALHDELADLACESGAEQLSWDRRIHGITC